MFSQRKRTRVFILFLGGKCYERFVQPVIIERWERYLTSIKTLLSMTILFDLRHMPNVLGRKNINIKEDVQKAESNAAETLEGIR